jgi:parvulin-like peptidyl-prolyl isomerase
MPITVNGEEVPDQLIQEEMTRLRLAPEWKAAFSHPVGALRLRDAAETYAIDRVLLRQESEKDASPIDPVELDRALAVARTAPGFRTGVNEDWVRRTIERNMRFQRTLRYLVGELRGPSRAAVRRAYEERRESFRKPEEIHAAHIVRHVDETHPESDARAGIESALADLNGGMPFAEAVERHSDCKDGGGDLGFFARGVMVDEFDAVAFALEPGERSAIFRTPFGFHIVEAREKRASRVAEFEEVAPQIERLLFAAAEQREVQRVFAELRKRAKIARGAAHDESRAAGAA